MTTFDETGDTVREQLPNHVQADVLKSVQFFPEPENPAGISAEALDEQIETLGAEAFGPGRYARAAFRLREDRQPEFGLSFSAWLDGELVGSVRQTKILIGGKQALVLGPLVVLPKFKNAGIGACLMKMAVDASREGGHAIIILVGDHPYYKRFGFEKVPHGRITLPGPADPARILFCELQEGALKDYAGVASRYSQNSIPA